MRRSLPLVAASLVAACGGSEKIELPGSPPQPITEMSQEDLERLRVEQPRDVTAARRRRLGRTHRLRVHTDGCGVIRSSRRREPEGLQWSVSDMDGFDVLERNALGEDRYRYFQPGTYRVVLEAWDGAAYAPVSNAVTIRC